MRKFEKKKVNLKKKLQNWANSMKTLENWEKNDKFVNNYRCIEKSVIFEKKCCNFCQKLTIIGELQKIEQFMQHFVKKLNWGIISQKNREKIE